ncbi:hypothetical protein GCM10028803_48000 [Larkinella knui]|uniref:Glycosyltransferase RgtA/B/C/D-like domain-containing protein n=1 Tax=Larkinella knui TaxID=2025310 RepID=A0A3P1CQ51_9BACT|nr:hypothetical protein [Larkinella knui]RRB15378.1 hypothetical protein EHT87_12660 [Larkinella knui]
METVVYALPFRLFSMLVLAGWSVVIGRKALIPNAFPRFSTRTMLGISFLLFIGIRLLYAQNREHNVDTSTWIATALTVGQAEDPLYTLLNYSDGRPLAVLPLALVELAGIPVDYRLADLIGVLLWCLTFWIFWRLLKNYLAEERALLLVWLPILLLSTVWKNDFASFNSENMGNLWLITGLFWILRGNTGSAVRAFAIGFWLGWLPFVKFQTVPMGLVFGLFAAWKLYQTRRFVKVFSLVGGALLPVLLLTLYYGSRDDLTAFWGDYFSNYFVYSYTTEYSDLSPAERFSPLHIARYLFQSYQFPLYWTGIFGGILLYGIGLVVRRPVSLAPEQKERLWLGGIWLIASFYAVLQAGNNYTHYLLFLLLPGLLVLAVLSELSRSSFNRKILFFCLLTVLTQASVNGFFRKPLDIHPGEPLFQKISAEIRQRSQAEDGLVLWGYVDRLYSYTRRPMGYRASDTFWVYYPTSTREFRIKEFLSDMERNKPRLFVDVLSPRISLFAENAFEFENFPSIKTYIDRHYRLVKTIEDVRIFERKKE